MPYIILTTLLSIIMLTSSCLKKNISNDETYKITQNYLNNPKVHDGDLFIGFDVYHVSFKSSVNNDTEDIMTSNVYEVVYTLDLDYEKDDAKATIILQSNDSLTWSITSFSKTFSNKIFF